MRLGIFAAAALLMVTGSSTQSAETIVGPIAHICRDVTADMERASLTLMWVTGYVSGVNNLTKVDFLKNKDIGNIIDRFRDVCLESPHKTVLEAARTVVARFRMDLVKP